MVGGAIQEEVLKHIWLHINIMKTNSYKTEVLILGAGVAGLSASIALNRVGLKDSLILEKEAYVGGLNRNTTLDGCDFDYGPKILLLDDSENSVDLLSFLNENYEKYPVVEKVYLSQYGLLDFPLQRNLIDLPENERKKILEDVEKVQLHPIEIKSFKDWLINGFGEYFCNLILFPYEEKKWQVDLDEMDYMWALNRPIKVNYEEVLAGSIQKLSPNRSYYYPKVGTIANLTSEMEKQSAKILTNCEVISINIQEKIVTTNRGEFPYKFLISSLPLDFFIKIVKDSSPDIMVSDTNFKRLSILVFNLVFEGNHDLEGTAIYYPEKEFCFRRVSILQNLCPALARKDKTPISVELSIKDGDKINEKEKLEEILSDLSKIPAFKQLGRPTSWDVLQIPFAYPLQINGLSEKVKELHSYFEKYNVFQCGRGGSFDYCNSDVAYKQGKEAVLKLFKKTLRV
jgi:protoporphyrinogen oxidase